MKTRGLPHFVLSCSLANFAFTASAAAPSVTSQPRDETVLLYQPAGFGVVASGTAPLSYQWHKDGIPIAGATNDQIIFAHPQLSDAGGYSVEIGRASCRERV